MSDFTDDAKDLDSYGVWVKKPPKDIREDTAQTPLTGQNAAENTQSELFEQNANPQDAAPFDMNERTPEELSESAEAAPDDFFTETFTEEKADEPKSDAPIIEDGEISLDSFMGGDFSDGIDFAAIEQAASAPPDGEISLDDFLDDASSFSSPEKEDAIPDDAPLDINIDFNTPEDSAVMLEDMSDDDDSADADAGNADDAEMLGAMPKVEIFSGDTFEQKMSAPPSVSTETTEVSLDDFAIDSDAPETLGGSEEVDLADFGIDSDADETPVTSNVKEKKLKEVIDYDLAISEDDSASAAPVAAVTDANNQTYQDEDMTGQNESSEMNNKLLEQLVADLSELRKEMSLLKNEFAELRAHAPAGGSSEHTAPSDELDGGASAEETAVQPESTGFFSNDDDDDTIALSGDELDNIMNTADFSDGETAEEGAPEDGATESVPDECPATMEAESEESAADTTAAEESALPADAPASASDAADTSDSDMFDITEPVFDEASENAAAQESEAAETAPSEPRLETEAPASDMQDAAFDGGLSIEENENLEEPDLSNLNGDEALPDEIAIPRVDDIAAESENAEDIMVESSSTDFMDSVKDTTDAQAEFSDMDDFNEPEALNDMEEPEAANETAADAPVDESAVSDDALQNDALLDGFPDDDEPSISDTLSKESEEYLKEDEAIAPDADGEFNGTEPSAPVEGEADADNSLPDDLKEDVKSVLLYMDQLLENLPEEKIMEFAKSEQFITYKKLFSELGLA